MAAMHAAAVVALVLLAAPLAAAAAAARDLPSMQRALLGTGPAYWQEASRYPLHYPAAQAAAEGFVASPMGGSTFCNARLVKPVCADGIWVQNRCIAELQDLKILADTQCPEARDVFAGAPAPAAATTRPGTLTHPIPVTSGDLKKYESRGFVFRGLAGSGADKLQALDAQGAKGVVDAGSHFWWSAPAAGPRTPK